MAVIVDPLRLNPHHGRDKGRKEQGRGITPLKHCITQRDSRPFIMPRMAGKSRQIGVNCRRIAIFAGLASLLTSDRHALTYQGKEKGL
jgi:hypothetical protein